MQNNFERAKIFNSFDALKGLNEALELERKIYINKKDINEDLENRLNQKLINLKTNENIKIKYYYNMDYIETYGTLKKIDKYNKKIYLSNSIIDIDDILDIEVL